VRSSRPSSGRLPGLGKLSQAIQVDSAVLGDNLGDPARCLNKRTAVIVGAKPRNHFAAEASHFAIGQDGLKSVTDLNPVLVIIHGEQNHDAAVIALVADSPAFEEPIRKIGGLKTLEGMDSDERDLCGGLLINFATQSGDLLRGLGVQDSSEVVYVALRSELVELFSLDRRRKKPEAECRDDHSRFPSNAFLLDSQASHGPLTGHSGDLAHQAGSQGLHALAAPSF
jgi:hypothetical protein